METLTFDLEVNAPQQKVWDIFWTKESYEAWTKPFASGSTMTSDWTVGGRTIFHDGTGNGMISTIERLHEPNEVIFKHLGMIQDGKEDLDSEEVKAWAGSLEKYQLTDSNGKTQLHVEVDMQAEYIDMMNKGFEQGLAIVKQLSEQ